MKKPKDWEKQSIIRRLVVCLWEDRGLRIDLVMPYLASNLTRVLRCLNYMFKELFKGKLITFDVDGVLALSQQPVIDEINLRYGLNKKSSELTDWHSVSSWLKEITVDSVEARRIEDELWFNPGIIGRSGPTCGARNLLYRLTNEGATLRIITGRPSRLNKVTRDFILSNFDFIRADQIEPNPFDDIKKASDFKPRRIGAMEPFAHVEDSIAQIKAILFFTANTRIVMVPNSWNLQSDLKDSRLHTPRVSDRQNMPNLWPIYSILHNLVAQY